MILPAEIANAFDNLKADGVVLLSNYEGAYLGDARFEPIWAELNRRAAVVFIHPGHPDLALIEGMPGPMVYYPFDTPRAAVQIALNGVLDRYQNLNIILFHAGGFIPYAAYRFAEIGALLKHSSVTADEFLAKFQRFYYDTALSSSPAALPTLQAFAGTQNILYGSDFPYAPASVGATFTKYLDAYEGFSADDHKAIHHGNALKLFPRLAALA